MATILVVDDDRAFRELVVDILAPEGHRLLQASSAEEALRRLAEIPAELVLTDQRMPGADGIELVRRVQRLRSPPRVVVMTAFGTIPQAVEAVRLGAADYLTKPLESPAALRQLVRRVLGEHDRPAAEGDELLTADPATLEVLTLTDRAAATDVTILVHGESGTGKELLARRIHRRSRRADGPFVAVNCAAIPESLAESELFGHERGAFTGAESRREGRFEQAGGGTLFLDEVGELPEAIQATLLRVLEDRTVERVGGGRSVPVDVRLVAATNRDLEAEVEAGRFRTDLFFRLNVVPVWLPPLRERTGDLELLVPALVEQLAARLGTPARQVEPEAMAALVAHPWPGNVRELRNVLERALIISPGDTIGPSDLPRLSSQDGGSDAGGSRPLSLEARERQAILEALERSGGHRQRAAELLGISVRTLYTRLREYGITT